ncbi:hypothetical protein Q1W73_01785 [Asticcacaulis sp. ZE23SCel15]|uniref:hypothetical protein n=1 Tax=Asticcacaulis sp. ZE23SCel15 TaxID=3059027 RepID=UPI00265F5DF6|nr:hypothetical protein [Asticcacaulis sp. ZE23SCel15]WKL57737.1 hypothetical protein Q1W73_01785 [Asticcacaulis sp. ZE23SCel15]
MPNRNPILPLNIQAALIDFGKALSKGHVVEAQLDALIKDLDTLPAQAITAVDSSIAYFAELHRPTHTNTSLLSLFQPDISALALLNKTPKLAHIYLFHRDGYVREAALHSFTTAPQSPFFLAAIAYRLNDWVQPVRVTAQYCAKRIFPKVAPEVVVGAAPYLISRWRYWGRWKQEDASIIDSLFDRTDVMALWAERYSRAITGPLGTELRFILRSDGFDTYLHGLARGAIAPSVRATALKALLDGFASWPIGFDRQWIDKRFYIYRRITRYAQRDLKVQCDKNILILEGLCDKSPAVRRIAADALIECRETFPEIIDAITRLQSDRSPSIRERGDFLARKRAEEIDS